MKWLTLEDIYEHLRIVGSNEDSLLETYGASAENVVLNIIGRDVDNVLEVWGEIPADLRHASLMLVDLSYQFRTMVSVSSLSVVPYTFDVLVKPYMKLSDCNC